MSLILAFWSIIFPLFRTFCLGDFRLFLLLVLYVRLNEHLLLSSLIKHADIIAIYRQAFTSKEGHIHL